MKNLRNNKGFTLIELLAVIVVLAIIMMIATTQVIPLITDSRKGGFTSTANTIVSATETVVLADEVKGQSTYGTFCYTVEYLIDSGYLSNISAATDTTSGYEGYVKVKKNSDEESGSSYNYSIYLVDYSTSYNVSGYDYTTNGLLDSSDTTYFKTEIADTFTADPADDSECGTILPSE